MKKCFKCGEEKELSEFYKHPQTKDGRLNKCKECSKKEVKKNRIDNVEHYKDYEKKRYEKSGARYKNKNYQEEYRKTERSRESKRSWAKRNKHKRRAQGKLSKELNKNTIIRPVVCSICGCDKKNIEGHHHDYNKPLDVVWCCIECHGDIHANRVEKIINKQNQR